VVETTRDDGGCAVTVEGGDLRGYARGLLQATTLEGKLAAPPAGSPDVDRRPVALPDQPARPPGLEPAEGGAKLPPLSGLPDPAQRARLLHGWFNHELQAVELFAWALLTFPEAPGPFRRGLLTLLEDEQRHARLYVQRLAAHGHAPGDFPVSAYLWNKRGLMDTPLRFVAAMCLTFENANLDHTLDAAAAARDAGDPETADVLERVHAEELTHVAFGLRWLERFKAEGTSMVDAWQQALGWPLRPALARGPLLHVDCRRRLGMPDAFVDVLQDAAR
jgi:uncharacterized ferritin-like protein (DUF455 family)